MLALAALLGSAGRHIAQAEVASGPVQAVIGRELQSLDGKLVTVLVLGPQAPPQGLQGQGLRSVPPLKLQRLYRDIGHPAHGLSVIHIQPGPDRALALLQLPVLRTQILAQMGQIDMREVQISLSAPALQTPFMHRQQRLLEVAHDRKALAPALWRRGIQPQGVVPALVAQHQIHILQLQGRGIAQLVHPLQLAAADGDFGLGEDPVGVGSLPRIG